jgi:alanine-glyoxylate transaminase/serine-glyoxylate transaminase/serine-pyruvate transaminase
MLPPGMAFNAISAKALAVAGSAKLAKSYFAWEEMLKLNSIGLFPYTPATNMLHGLVEAIDMLHQEGLENVFARHQRLAEATRRAVTAWGLEILCRDPSYYSPTVTAVLLPPGHDADQFRQLALAHFDVSLGTGFGKFAGNMFRIGHLGDTNDVTVLAALASVEMTLALAGIPHQRAGVQSAMAHLIAAAAAQAIDTGRAVGPAW